jgi:quinolinate synthase
LADEVASTEGFVRYAKSTSVKELIIGTEVGMLTRLRKELPEKTFIPVSEHAICPNMKKNTLEKVLWSLEELKTEVVLPELIRLKAKKAIDRMVEIA